ncbi:ABC transporter permease [Nesterenkonia alba]|uniref:ABC transporter permease n=1 Tax=Nesterenkonia alba TaxID=515814 RepID=UPI0003B457A4|nr:ABC transporter permease [Nesterenkonia alba]
MAEAAAVEKAATTAAKQKPDKRPARDWQLISAVVLVVLLLAMAVSGLSMQDTVNRIDVANTLQTPGPGHWFGTDGQGRDVFARVAYGTWIAVSSGFIAVAAGGGGGLLVALLCGLGPRWLDIVLMRICDAILAFPQFLLALAITMAFGAGLQTAIVGIIITIIPVFARTLRGEARRATTEPFVEAARTIGLSTPHIAVRHVIPYLSTTFIVQAAANFGNTIILLSALSFIGMGAQPPTAEWGAMITDGMAYVLTGNWWIGLFPGLALVLLVLAVNLLADRLPSLLARKGGKN